MTFNNSKNASGSSPASALRASATRSIAAQFFSSFGIGEVEDLDKPKGGDSRPSGLKTFKKHKP